MAKGQPRKGRSRTKVLVRGINDKSHAQASTKYHETRTFSGLRCRGKVFSPPSLTYRCRGRDSYRSVGWWGEGWGLEVLSDS